MPTAEATSEAHKRSPLFPKTFLFRNQTLPSRRFISLLAFAVVIVAVLGIVLLCWFAFRKAEVVVQLAPGAVEKQGVTVPPQGFNVKLELAVADPNFKNYKSELFRENTPVQTNALKIEKKVSSRLCR